MRHMFPVLTKNALLQGGMVSNKGRQDEASIQARIGTLSREGGEGGTASRG